MLRIAAPRETGEMKTKIQRSIIYYDPTSKENAIRTYHDGTKTTYM